MGPGGAESVCPPRQTQRQGKRTVTGSVTGHPRSLHCAGHGPAGATGRFTGSVARTREEVERPVGLRVDRLRLAVRSPV